MTDDPMKARTDAIYADFAREVDKGLDQLALIPERLHYGLRHYALDGGRVGQFLTACADNDLREAISRADDESLVALRQIVQFFYNFAPGQCHGSPEKREKWQAHGGIKGAKI